jgi:cysteine desulfurase family protein
LDNAATSWPKPPEVLDAVAKALAAPASPGRSGHRPAHEASKLIHKARRRIQGLFGLPSPERVSFAANVTWAINEAIEGFGLKEGDLVISSALEHNSTARPLSRLRAQKGIVWKIVPPRGDGLLHAGDFKDAMGPKLRLIVINHASNVTGALAPVKEIRAQAGDVPMLLDAAQTAGAVPMEDIGQICDIVCFTGHKGLLGPTGTGGLWVREGIELRPLAVGGSGSKSESLTHPDFMPDRLEAGTLNTHGLAGLAAGIDYILQRGVQDIRAHESGLTRLFLERLSGIPGLRVLGPQLGEVRRVATVSVTLDGWSSSDIARELEATGGIMIRSGLHCAPLAHEAMGTFPGGAARFSFGPFSQESDIVAAADALKGLSSRKRPGTQGANAQGRA